MAWSTYFWPNAAGSSASAGTMTVVGAIAHRSDAGAGEGRTVAAAAEAHRDLEVLQEVTFGGGRPRRLLRAQREGPRHGCANVHAHRCTRYRPRRDFQALPWTHERLRGPATGAPARGPQRGRHRLRGRRDRPGAARR